MTKERCDDAIHEGPKPISRNRKTLLRKFDIPIEELDYKFVESCSDSKKLERILRILQSGEEGVYRDLEDFVSRKLAEIEPLNRHLRTETPIMRPDSLPSSELRDLELDLTGWIQSTTADNSARKSAKTIFKGGDPSNAVDPPVRHSAVISGTTGKNALFAQGDSEDGIPFLKPANPNRIKSWEYDKWNKFDVDEELMKLEIQEMRQEEEEALLQGRKAKGATNSQPKAPPRVKKEPKPSQQQESTNQKKEQEESPRPCCSKSLSASSNHFGRSFIEEIQQEEKPKGKRRVKIFIDDVNAAGKI